MGAERITVAGPYATWPTGPYGRVVPGPPSSGTVCAQLRRRLAWPWVVIARTSPSGVQPRTWVRALPQWVSLLDGPPSTGAMCTSGAPSRTEVQATVVPSGDIRGWVTGTLSALTRQARPPSSGASHTSSSAVKATSSPCRCGNRRYADVAGCVTRSPYARSVSVHRGFDHLPSGQHCGSFWHQIVLVTVTVTVAPGCRGLLTGGGGVALQSPSPSTWNHCLPPTVAVRSPRTHAPLTVRVTLPLTVMSLPSRVFPSQLTVATVFTLALGVRSPLSYEAVQVSQLTSAFCRFSSLVTSWSVVYDTVAELTTPVGSHAATPPTASTATPITPAARTPRGRRQLRLNATMHGSLPLSRPGR